MAVLVALATLSACGGTMSCPAGTEMVDGRCVFVGIDAGPTTRADGGPPSPGDDAGPPAPDAGPMDAGTPVVMMDAGPPPPLPDAGPPPPLPDAGPPTCSSPDRWYRDLDGDGFGDSSAHVDSCDPVEGFVRDSRDCDDGCSACHPGASEICDSRDNDCDGSTDEGALSTFYLDGDGDGHGNASRVAMACTAPAGYVGVGDDCDDGCAACHPGASEICDSRDNDCNGSVDEGATHTYYLDGDRDGHGDPGRSTVACSAPAGYVTSSDDCDDACNVCWTGASETCDSRDNNCNGSIDEGVTHTYYLDGDRDGHGDPGRSTVACSAPTGYVTSSDDCDDACNVCWTGASESCDSRDNNCNGSVDEGVTSRFYRDQDMDGHGTAATSIDACSAPAGFVASNDDCNDACAVCYPGRAESCDGLDNDCNAIVDNGVLLTFYRDGDGDGHGNAALSMAACTAPSGFVASSDDCNDACGFCYPGRAESCDGADNDCDGAIDDGVLLTFYRDADGDTYGTSATTMACMQPAGYAGRAGDCDDANANRNPGHAEVCNGIDDDCSGAPDQTFACVQGTATTCTTTCGSTGSGLCSASCALPTGASCNPPVETCNHVDDDCDSMIDDGVMIAGAVITGAAIGDAHRPRIARDGSYVYSFWPIASNVYGWRHRLDGTLDGPAQVPMLTGSDVFDIDARAGSVVYATVASGSANVTVRWLNPTTLVAVATYTITPSLASVWPTSSVHVALSADGNTAHVFFGSDGDTSTWINRVAVNRTSGVGTEQFVGFADGAWDVSGTGAHVYATWVDANGPTRRVQATDLDTASGTTATRTIWTPPTGTSSIDPSVVGDGAGGVYFAWASRNSTTPAMRFVYAAKLTSWTATPQVATLSASGTSTADPVSASSGAQISLTDVSFADGVLAVSALESPSSTSTVGIPDVYHVNWTGTVATSFAIDPGLVFTTDQGLPILHSSAASPDLLFFNPSGSNVAVKPLGCF